ncbi:MAG: hypothetical protein FWD69_08060 [Polyangiaceae bacterium]|nr:hypothetical protein [Polyangiaceae bacterium]
MKIRSHVRTFVAVFGLIGCPSQQPPNPAADAPDLDDAVDAIEPNIYLSADAEAPLATQIDEKLEGALYTKEVRAAFRVAGCGGDDALIPPNIDRAMVDAHCAALTAGYAEYKKEWLDVAMPFIAKIRPANTPSVVVYPFGGGDLVSALATYPDGTEFTTISLEIAGDVRGILKADNEHLERQLATLRSHLGKLFLKAHSRTINLDIETHGAIPGEIAFTMAALAIHGYEPVTLRYFSIEDDGALHWLTEEEIEQADNTRKKGRGGPFSNAEIRFKKPGDTRIRILRHIAFDLSNTTLAGKPGLLRHLDTKAKVSTMTKAASHLLWDDKNFSTLRDWLMKHTDWMISDTTGVPPRIAKKYGFVQDVYGQYEWPEPFGTADNKDATDFRDLFKGHDPLPFRYGYPDNKSHGHIVVTRRL